MFRRLDQLELGHGIDLRAIEFRAEEREFVGADVEAKLVRANQWLIAYAGAARMARRVIPIVAGVKGEDGPVAGGITRLGDCNIEMRLAGKGTADVIEVQLQGGHKPVAGRRVIVALGVG